MQRFTPKFHLLIPRSLFLPSRRILISSLLVALAKPPFRLTFLTWICLLPWLLECHLFFSQTRTRSNLQGLLFLLTQSFWLSFFESSLSYFWLFSSIQEFGQGLGAFSFLTSLFLFQITCAFFLEPQYPLVALILWICHQKVKPGSSLLLRSAFIFSMIYAVTDSLVPKLFQFTLSYHLPHFLTLKQLAELGGPFLITFLILLFQNLIFILGFKVLVTQRFTSLRELLQPILAGTSCLILAFTFGSWRLHTLKGTSVSPTSLNLAVIQGHIENTQKLEAEKGVYEAAENSLTTLLDLSKEAINHSPPPEILLWPETSFPTVFTTLKTSGDFLLQNKLKSSLSAFSTPILFGAFHEKSNRLFNVAHLLEFAPTKKIQTYSKMHLFPFAEWVPFLSSFEFFQKFFPKLAPFNPGEELKIFSFYPSKGEIRIGPLICYDSLFPKHTMGLLEQKADFLVLITNDAWFGPWAAELHLNISSFRSVETRLPLVSVANTGISALVLPDGSITKTSSYGKREVLNFSVPIQKILKLSMVFKKMISKFF